MSTPASNRPGTPPFDAQEPILPPSSSTSYPTTTVYFLTNPSHTNTVAIKHELEAHGELDHSFGADPSDHKQFSYIPWPHTADGTGADILRITKEKGDAIFVDARSAEDKTVILASKGYDDEGEEIIGVEYGRCKGREVLIHWVNLDLRNMVLQEVVEGEKVVIRDPETVDTTTG
ncbi:MAG: hypothetical protein Q9187_008174 [Circinaria calcarea]